MLIADDHAVVRGGIIGIVDVQSDMKVVAAAQDGLTALEQFFEQSADVALIDI